MTADRLATPAIVGIASCGKLQGAVVDGPDQQDKRNTAKFVARMIRQGLRIETWTCEAVRKAEFCFGCDVCRPKRKKASPQIEAAL